MSSSVENAGAGHIEGLVAATFTPMQANGDLDLDRVPAVVDRLVADGVTGLYVCGSTGEGPSLTSAERCAVVRAYVHAAGARIPVIAHVGHNSLREAQDLAADAVASGAAAIAAAPPSYFRPASADALADCMADIAAAAPSLPFYYYHIPAMTGVGVPMTEFLRSGKARIETLAGLKFSSQNIAELQLLLGLDGGRWDVLFGCDEMLLAALCVGARGAVGSTYNLFAPLFRLMIDAFDTGRIEQARRHQIQAARLIEPMVRRGGLPAIKAAMEFVGCGCGPTRLPLVALDERDTRALQDELEVLRGKS